MIEIEAVAQKLTAYPRAGPYGDRVASLLFSGEMSKWPIADHTIGESALIPFLDCVISMVPCPRILAGRPTAGFCALTEWTRTIDTHEASTAASQ